jgi:hypothetical protein
LRRNKIVAKIRFFFFDHAVRLGLSAFVIEGTIIVVAIFANVGITTAVSARILAMKIVRLNFLMAVKAGTHNLNPITKVVRALFDTHRISKSALTTFTFISS